MTAQPRVFPANDHQVLSLSLVVRDPEVVAELGGRTEGLERDSYALHALRIGTLALRQAAGGIDIDAIRRAGEDVVRAVQTVLVDHSSRVNGNLTKLVADYFDPKSGSLPQRIEQLVKGDGDIERAIHRHFDGDRSTLYRTLDGILGPQSPLQKLLSPEQSGSVVNGMKTALDGLLKQQRDEVLRQFSLDRKDSALSRLLDEVTSANGKLRGDLAHDVNKVVQEFSLDNEKGALSRLVGRVEKAQKTIVEQLSLDHADSSLQRMKRELVDITRGIEQSQATFQTEIREAVASLQTQRRIAAKTPLHGNSFEDDMETFLGDESSRASDIYERTGAKPTASGSKKGDHVITLGHESAASGARIVVESKAKKTCTLPEALAELALARGNRNASVGVFVFKAGSAPNGVEGIRRFGNDIVAVWDPADATTDIYLRAAVSVARAIAVRERTTEEDNESALREIEHATHEIEKQAKHLDDIVKAGKVIGRNAEAIIKAAEPMRSTLETQLELLRQNVATMRSPAEP